MWYEDGQLRPFLVRLMTPISPFRGGLLPPKRKVPRERRAQTPGGRARRQPPNRGRECSRQSNPHEGGDNRQWQRKPRAGRRRPARNGKLTSPVKKRGRLSPPFRLFSNEASLRYSFTSGFLRPTRSPAVSRPTAGSDQRCPSRRSRGRTPCSGRRAGAGARG